MRSVSQVGYGKSSWESIYLIDLKIILICLVRTAKYVPYIGRLCVIFTKVLHLGVVHKYPLLLLKCGKFLFAIWTLYLIENLRGLHVSGANSLL